MALARMALCKWPHLAPFSARSDSWRFDVYDLIRIADHLRQLNPIEGLHDIITDNDVGGQPDGGAWTRS